MLIWNIILHLTAFQPRFLIKVLPPVILTHTGGYNRYNVSLRILSEFCVNIFQLSLCSSERVSLHGKRDYRNLSRIWRKIWKIRGKFPQQWRWWSICGCHWGVSDDAGPIYICWIRPSLFNFLIYEKIFKILESGGRNKNKNKIPKIVQLIKK